MFTIRYLLVKGQSLHYMKYSCLDQCIYYTISLKLIYHKMREPACIGCSGPNVNFLVLLNITKHPSLSYRPEKSQDVILHYYDKCQMPGQILQSLL